MFMVNWPYVLAAAAQRRRGGHARPVRRRRHRLGALPAGLRRTSPARRRSAAPTSAIGALLDVIPIRPWPLVECVNALPKATQYMLDEGEPSPYAASYDDPAVREKYPNADLIRESIAEGGPRPLTPYYVDVAGVGDPDTWHPPAVGATRETPDETDTFMADVLSGKAAAVTDASTRPAVTVSATAGTAAISERVAAASAGSACSLTAAVAHRDDPGHRVPAGLRGGVVAVQLPAHRPGGPQLRRAAATTW